MRDANGGGSVTRSRPFLVVLAFCASILPGVGIHGFEEEERCRSASLRVVEGRVTDVGEMPAEGNVPAVAIRIGAGEDAVRLLLAPRTALQGAQFRVDVGDDVRARVFRNEQGIARVHKIQNLSRGSTVKLRTLRRHPLWDDSGAWQGSSGQRCAEGHGKGHGRRHRGGH